LRLLVLTLVLALPAAWLLAAPEGRALDRRTVHEARELTLASPPLELVTQLGTELGKATPLLVGLFVPAAFGAHAARTTAALGALSLGANQAVVSGLKAATGRVRPDGDDDRTNSSFPSSHASAAAGLAWVVGRRHARLAPWMGILAVWISVSRVFLERHFVSDLLAGALIGILFAALALHGQDRVARWTRPR
jgi:undecaprenyl-diphosphatase